MMAAAVLAQVDMGLQQDMLSQISARSPVSPMGSSSSLLQLKSSQVSFPSTSDTECGVATSKVVAEGGCLYPDPKGQPGVVWA